MGPTALIVVVGDEILSGEVTDTNSPWLAKQLTELGVEVGQIITIPDKVEEIAEQVGRGSSRFDWVLVTGGIGPTPDDVTREGVARALGVPLKLNPEAESALIRGYEEKVDEKIKGMAWLPQGSLAVTDENKGLLGFAIQNVWVFPGIPHLLKLTFDLIKERLRSAPIYRESFVTNLRESLFAEVMEVAMRKFPQVSIGSYVRLKGERYEAELVFRSRDQGHLKEAKEWLLNEIYALEKNYCINNPSVI